MSETFVNLTPAKSIENVPAVVGMAVYEKDKLDWLRAAVLSILNQTYIKYVFAIVIDGDVSNDISRYLEQLAKLEHRVLLFRSVQNVGLSRCMNYIAEYTLQFRPTFFFRMDSDDISERDRIQKQIDFLNIHPDVSILGTGLSEVNEYGKKVGERKLPLEHANIVKFLPKRCSLNHPTVVIRFSVFEQGFRYRESLMNTQDYFLWVELAANGYKFANLPAKLLRFRRVNNFYKRRGVLKSINECKARFYAMRELREFSVGNILYASGVLLLRLMPPVLVKLAYRLDRILLDKLVKH